MLAGEEANYLLMPRDLLKVKVFQEDDLESTVRVSQDGTVTLPLIGTVKVAGKSVRSAGASIQGLLGARFLVNPQVELTVLEYSKRRFTVLGQVTKPGTYDFPDQTPLNLLEAIGMAGGFSRLANPSALIVKRVIDGRQEILKLNAKRMARDEINASFNILSGDVITVGETLF